MKPSISDQRASLQSLTARERETLRLLLRGHDAKSIARDLGLSGHTINERLRDARRKLGVTSSREAARLLASVDQDPPNFVGDEEIGVAGAAPDPFVAARAGPHRSASHRLAWLSAGMLIMSLVVAAVALSFALHGGGGIGAGSTQNFVPIGEPTSASTQGGIDAARAWVALVDAQQWEQSWRTAAVVFKSPVSEAQWAQVIAPIRKTLGTASSRVVQSVTTAKSIPGAPAGEYEIVQFQTNFANRSGSIETVSLAHERTGWRVAGYFIR